MKYAFVLTVIILCNASLPFKNQEIGKLTNLKLIIPGTVVEKQGVVKNPEVETSLEDPKDEDKVKREICRNVFTTPYFSKQGEYEWFDIRVKENREFLELKYPHILITSVKVVEKKKAGILSPLLGGAVDYEYENVYKAGGLYTGLNAVDLSGYPLVFVCFVRRPLPSEEIIEYFVSKPFYLSFPDFDVVDIAGRFVFSGKEKMTLEAFAADVTNVKPEFDVNVNDRSGFIDLAMLGGMFVVSEEGEVRDSCIVDDKA